jgi:hypothetical protein
VQLVCLVGGLLVFAIELLVGLLQVAALKAGEFLESFHGGLQLSLGLFLVLLGILHPLHKNVPLFFSKRLHRLVISRSAAGAN